MNRFEKNCGNCKHNLNCIEVLGFCGIYKTCLTCICDTCKYALCASGNTEDKWEATDENNEV